MKSVLPGLALLVLLAGCRASSVDPVPRAELRATPTQLELGDVFSGGSGSAVVEVTNLGQTTLRVPLQLDPPFHGPDSLEVPGASSVALPLTFAPTAPGDFEATLAVGDQPVHLHGRGKGPLDCEAPNTCTLSHFDAEQGMCVDAAKPDGTDCGSRCVTAGNCSQGVCLGALVDCSDGNACTDDACEEATGCSHPPKSCPGSPTDPCRVGGCDPLTGCLITDAADGTACGVRDCHTGTTHVCILGACVQRPLASRDCVSLLGYLKASNTRPGTFFGGHLAVSADGNTVAVGAIGESSHATGVDGNQSDTSAPQSGAVYVFHRAGDVWSQQAYLKASNTGAGDSFGDALALSADGSTLAVGASLEDSNAVGVNGNPANDAAHDSGAVYVFRRAGGSWAQEAYLKASNTGEGDVFGTSVALSGDGNLLAVGASGEDSGPGGNPLDNSADESGAVYLFRRTGGWAQEAYLKAPNTEGGDLFGFSVALASDGQSLAIGALGEDSSATGADGNLLDNSAPQSGAVYVFRHSALGWALDSYLKASNTGAGDVFGGSLALSADGAVLAVGAWGEDSNATGADGERLDNSASQSGAVYVFRRGGGHWGAPSYLKASRAQIAGDFGFSLALSGDGKTLAVGAFGNSSGANGVDGDQSDTSAPQAGAVYLFRSSGTSGWGQQAYVKASNTGAGDLFGTSVALSADALTLVSGAVGEDSSATGVGGDAADNSAADSGAVYVFLTP